MPDALIQVLEGIELGDDVTQLAPVQAVATHDGLSSTHVALMGLGLLAIVGLSLELRGCKTSKRGKKRGKKSGSKKGRSSRRSRR